MKTKYSKLFQVKPDSKVRLKKINPDYTAEHTKRKSAMKEVERLDRKLRELQYLIYAEDKCSLLICLQALDAAGKDGTINHVLGSMNPQGARVHGFKAPSKEESEHDFLWRIERQVPKRGEVVIFNRSHYESRTFSTRRYSGARRGIKWRSWSKGLHYIGCGGVNDGGCLLR